MRFAWIPYQPSFESLLESWLDDEARRFTGCEDGWAQYYNYWLREEGSQRGQNFWALLTCEMKSPCAVFVLVKSPDNVFTVSECFVDPKKRGRGIGTAALRELVANSRPLLGIEIREAIAVVYPDNTASQGMFLRAGFRYAFAHPDGDALVYHYAKPMPCFCGHDCSRCVTRLAALLQSDPLRQRTQQFYRETFHRELPADAVRCRGGRSEEPFVLCLECPFVRCCRDREIDSCAKCLNPCSMLQEYRENFVNKCHQI